MKPLVFNGEGSQHLLKGKYLKNNFSQLYSLLLSPELEGDQIYQNIFPLDTSVLEDLPGRLRMDGNHTR